MPLADIKFNQKIEQELKPKQEEIHEEDQKNK
jgi:hypothetical protein